MLTARDIVELPAHRRKMVGKRRGKYKKEVRPVLTREELIEYLISHNFRSFRQLEAGRKKTEPDTNDFRKEFGSWQRAKEIAFGPEEERSFSPDYMAKVIVQFGLWTHRKYREARKKRPDVIPSEYWIKKQCGTYKQLKFLAIRFSIAETLNRYLVLARRLGRIPTTEDLGRVNMNMEAVLKFYGGKRKMDAFLKDIIGNFQ